MKIIAALLALTMTASAAPQENLTSDFASGTAPGKQVYSCNEKSYLVTLRNNGTNWNGSGYTPVMYWTTNNSATGIVAAACSWQSQTGGVFVATFSATDLNFAAGNYIYGVGASAGSVTIARQGSFTILRDPYAAGGTPVTFSTPVNGSLYLWSGTIGGTGVVFVGDGSQLTGVTAAPPTNMPWSSVTGKPSAITSVESGAYVSSFNTRTGAVSLTGADISGAGGLTNALAFLAASYPLSTGFTNAVRAAQTNAPAGAGGSPTNWSEYPATQPVNLNSNSLDNVTVMSFAGHPSATFGMSGANMVFRDDGAGPYTLAQLAAGGSGTDSNAWHVGDAVTGAVDSVARAWGNHATNGYLTAVPQSIIVTNIDMGTTGSTLHNGTTWVRDDRIDLGSQTSLSEAQLFVMSGAVSINATGVQLGAGQTYSGNAAGLTNLPAASVVGNVTGAVYAATAGSAGSASSASYATVAGSATNAANATNLNGQAAGYYLNGANITNAPSAWLTSTQITWAATQNAGAQAATNVATLGFTNSITLKSGSLGGTNGIYFTDNGTNYWILKPSL